MVQRVILRPKRNAEVDTAEWQIVSLTEHCDTAASSRSELIRGKLVTRPKKDEVFVNEIPLDLMRMVRCLGIALSNDKWLDVITIWARDTEGEVPYSLYLAPPL